MPTFRKRPVLIDAEQFRAAGTFPAGVCEDPCLDGEWTKPHVHTMHNNQAVILEDGDWIVPEPDGVHFYPVKPEVFAANYEPA